MLKPHFNIDRNQAASLEQMDMLVICHQAETEVAESKSEKTSVSTVRPIT